MEQTTRKGSWQIWVGLLVGVACLAAVFIFFAKPGEIIESLRHVHFSYLLLGAAGVVLFLAVRAVRWRFMLANAAPYAPVFHIQNIGYMLTQLLPLRLGDVARAVLIGNVPPITIAQGISTMVVERLLDMVFIVVLLPFWAIELAQGAPVPTDALSIAAVVYIGLFISLLAFLVWNRCIVALGPTVTGVSYHLVAAFTAIVAYVALGEALATYHLVGIALILAGFFLAALRR